MIQEEYKEFKSDMKTKVEMSASKKLGICLIISLISLTFAIGVFLIVDYNAKEDDDRNSRSGGGDGDDPFIDHKINPILSVFNQEPDF